jgi:hypothetical protein
VFEGISPGIDDLKALSAGLGVGKVNMFLLEYEGKLEAVSFGREELRETYEELNTAEEVDVVCIGCPHCSLAEIRQVLEKEPEKDTWVFTGRQNAGLFRGEDRVRIVSDTCMVVSPLEELGIEAIGVNSAKAAFYASHLSDIKVRFDSLENLLR